MVTRAQLGIAATRVAQSELDKSKAATETNPAPSTGVRDTAVRDRTDQLARFQEALGVGGYQPPPSTRFDTEDDDDDDEPKPEKPIESELAPLVGLVNGGRVVLGEGIAHSLREFGVHLVADEIIETIEHAVHDAADAALDWAFPSGKLDIVDFTDEEAEADFELARGGKDQISDVEFDDREAESDWRKANTTKIEFTDDEAKEDFDVSQTNVDEVDFSEQEGADDVDLTDGGSGGVTEIEVSDDEAEEDFIAGTSGGGDSGSDVTFSDDEAEEDWASFDDGGDPGDFEDFGDGDYAGGVGGGGGRGGDDRDLLREY